MGNAILFVPSEASRSDLVKIFMEGFSLYWNTVHLIQALMLYVQILCYVHLMNIYWGVGAGEVKTHCSSWTK